MNTKDKLLNTDECLDEISQRLYEISIKNHWTLEKLSEKTGVSSRHLHDILYGHAHDMRLSTLVKISQNLNEPIASLMGIAKNPLEEQFKALVKLCNETSIALKRGAAL